jgi:KAP family P-loop domain
VVLYIDDLDRCPPGKVLQVLEAVHLLLAFQQFVVVVAVDQRWLRSALIRQLPALSEALQVSANVGEREDQPTAQDYVEKIFQLPLWVQSVKANERARIVTGLLSGSVRAPAGDDRQPRSEIQVGPSQEAVVKNMLAHAGTGLRSETSTLALTAGELEFIGSLGPILGDTPRRVKRFVNTVQLLLSVRPALSGEGATSPRLTLCLFAAIHDGLPRLARVMFSPLHADEPINVAVSSPEAPEPEKAILQEWLGVPGRVAWGNVLASSLGDRLEMVRRIGFDPPGS